MTMHPFLRLRGRLGQRRALWWIVALAVVLVLPALATELSHRATARAATVG